MRKTITSVSLDENILEFVRKKEGERKLSSLINFLLKKYCEQETNTLLDAIQKLERAKFELDAARKDFFEAETFLNFVKNEIITSAKIVVDAKQNENADINFIIERQLEILREKGIIIQKSDLHRYVSQLEEKEKKERAASAGGDSEDGATA